MRLPALLLLIFIFSLNALSNNPTYITDTLSRPIVRFKDWNKTHLPIEKFKDGSKLIVKGLDDKECKVISYTFGTTDIHGFYITVHVNSNKFDGKVLDYFKKMKSGSRFLIENIKVQYSNGIITSAESITFKKVEDEFEEFVQTAFQNNPYTNDFGIFKTNIRIKLEGKTDSSDYRIVNELINELQPLLKSVSICMVDKDPTLIINFKQSDISVKDTILNPLFPELKRREIYLSPDEESFEHRKLILNREIVHNLADFIYNCSWNDSYIIGCNPPKELTTFDRLLISKLYSLTGQDQLRKILNKQTHRKADNTILVLILSVLIFIAISGIISHYRFLNILELIKNKYIKNAIQSLLIIQIPVFLLLFFTTNNKPVIKQLISYELSIGLIAILVASFLTSSDSLIKKIKISGVYLLVDFLLTTTFFLVSYQILYFFIVPELIQLKNLDAQWLFIPITIVAYRSFLNYSQKRMSSLMQEKELELTKQKEIALKSELLALQSRINPHFLYNALNSIASLVRIDANKTEEMTIALAKLFRYNTNKESETYSTIDQEINIIQIYLNVEMVRFSDRLKYTININNKLYTEKIPSFLIQPLVENAIKHGISKLTETGFIQIKISIENSWLVISVYDNGPDFPEHMMMNYGLQSVIDKLTLLYKDDYKLEFNNKPNKNITIRIKQ